MCNPPSDDWWSRQEFRILLFFHDKVPGGTGIRCLSGVELDAQDFGINFHILGYGVDLENGQFQEFVEANRLRLERVNELLIEKMEHAGEPVSLDEYRQFSYDRRLGGWKALHYFAAKDLVADFKQWHLIN